MKALGKLGFAVLLLLFGAIAIYAVMTSRKSGSNPAAAASLNIGKTENTSSFIHSTTSSASDDAAFLTGKMSIVAPQKLPLARMIQKQLAIDLAGCDGLSEIVTADDENPMEQGVRGPEFFVNIEVLGHDTSGLVHRQTKAKVTVTLGNSPWQNSHYTVDGQSASLVNFFWRGVVEMDSTFTGVRTDGTAALAKEVSKTIAGGISNQLAGFAAKYEQLPPLPDAFYRPYVEVEEFAPLKVVQAKRMYSYSRLLSHNETFWKFTPAADARGALSQLSDAFTAQGWISYISSSNAVDYRAQFSKNGTSLEIFRERSGYVNEEQAAKEQGSYIAHFRAPFTREETQRVVDLLFSQKAPLQMLLPFKGTFNKEQQERFNELARTEESSASFGVQFAMARNYLHAKDTNAAVVMLLRAKALAVTQRSVSDAMSRVSNLAKEIYPNETTRVLKVEPEIYKQLGFLELAAGTSTNGIRKKFNEPLLLFASGLDGTSDTASILCKPLKNNVCEFAVSQSREGMSSRSTRTISAKEPWNISESLIMNKAGYLIRGVRQPGSDVVEFEIKSQNQTSL